MQKILFQKQNYGIIVEALLLPVTLILLQFEKINKTPVVTIFQVSFVLIGDPFIVSPDYQNRPCIVVGIRKLLEIIFNVPIIQLPRYKILVRLPLCNNSFGPFLT